MLCKIVVVTKVFEVPVTTSILTDLTGAVIATSALVAAANSRLENHVIVPVDRRIETYLDVKRLDRLTARSHNASHGNNSGLAQSSPINGLKLYLRQL